MTRMPRIRQLNVTCKNKNTRTRYEKKKKELGMTVFVENDLVIYHLLGIIRSLCKI